MIKCGEMLPLDADFTGSSAPWGCPRLVCAADPSPQLALGFLLPPAPQGAGGRRRSWGALL